MSILFVNINNACFELKEGNFKDKKTSDLPYPREDFWCSPQLPVYLTHHHFLAETCALYFSSFLFPREMAEGHRHGAIHEEEDGEDGKDFERLNNVCEMGR